MFMNVLTFRARTHIQDEIANFIPLDGDLDYPGKLEQSKQTNSAGISIGSEMSGGVSNITVENVHIWSSRRGIRIKTAPGRGGYVRKITYKNITLENLRVGIVIKTDYNEHLDEGFDPKAFMEWKKSR